MAPLAETDLPPQTRVEGGYIIVRRMSAGGMGTIYEATGPLEGQRYALKTVNRVLQENPHLLARFKEEASHLTKIRSDAVVRSLGFLEDRSLGLFLVMEYIDGETLDERVKGRGALGEAELKGLRRRLAEALTDIHRENIIHRDLSPDNILLPNGDVGRAKLIDFGISKPPDSGGAAAAKAPKWSEGKFLWMAPEQLNGDPVGKPADHYSAGLVLAFAATGRPLPLGGTSPQAALEKRRERLDLSQVPKSLQALLHRLLHVEPKWRGRLTANDWGRSATKGMVAVSALALGTAVVAFKFPDVPSELRDIVSGLLYPPAPTVACAPRFDGPGWTVTPYGTIAGFSRPLPSRVNPDSSTVDLGGNPSGAGQPAVVAVDAETNLNLARDNAVAIAMRAAGATAKIECDVVSLEIVDRERTQLIWHGSGGSELPVASVAAPLAQGFHKLRLHAACKPDAFPTVAVELRVGAGSLRAPGPNEFCRPEPAAQPFPNPQPQPQPQPLPLPNPQPQPKPQPLPLPNPLAPPLQACAPRASGWNVTAYGRGRGGGYGPLWSQANPDLSTIDLEPDAARLSAGQSVIAAVAEADLNLSGDGNVVVSARPSGDTSRVDCSVVNFEIVNGGRAQLNWYGSRNGSLGGNLPAASVMARLGRGFHTLRLYAACKQGGFPKVSVQVQSGNDASPRVPGANEFCRANLPEPPVRAPAEPPAPGLASCERVDGAGGPGWLVIPYGEAPRPTGESVIDFAPAAVQSVTGGTWLYDARGLLQLPAADTVTLAFDLPDPTQDVMCQAFLTVDRLQGGFARWYTRPGAATNFNPRQPIRTALSLKGGIHPLDLHLSCIGRAYLPTIRFSMKTAQEPELRAPKPHEVCFLKVP